MMLPNWRQILSWRNPEEDGDEYSQEPDFGEEREFRAPYSEYQYGYVRVDARCKKEAIQLLEDGNFDTEGTDSDNFEIYYNDTAEYQRRRLRI